MESRSNDSAAPKVAIAPRPVPVASNPSRRIPNPPSKRKRIACKECRQGKLKCENSNLHTCSRCKSLGLSCVYDNEYRRYNKRLILRELTAEVEKLRAVKAGANNQSSSPSHQHDASSFQPREAAGDSPRISNEPSRIPQWDNRMASPSTGGIPRWGNRKASPSSLAFVTTQAQNALDSPRESRPALYPRSISNTSLSALQITRFFQIFDREYWPHIPIIETQISPDDCFAQSPLLFWTIIAIASRKDEEEPTTLASLAPPIKSLLWQTVGDPPHSRPDLKAMILICLWPFPTSSMSTDSSYILAASAKSSAMHIGLHKPHSEQDFSRIRTGVCPGGLKDAIMIWSACFIAAESTTSMTGQQPLFVTDATLQMICNSNNCCNILPDLYHLILIWRYCNRLHRVMASRERRMGTLGENDSGVLLPLFEGELDELRQQLGFSLSKNNEIIFLYASLQLRCYYFLERYTKTSLKEGILKAYRSALRIIEKSQEMESEVRLLSCGPIMFSHAISLASTFALKVLQSSYARLVDAEEGRKAFNLSLGLLRKCSIEDSDLCGRFSKILAQLWSAPPDLSSSQNGLKITTRLSGSLLHDTLWKWREKFGDQSTGPRGLHAAQEPVMAATDSSEPPLGNFSNQANDHNNGPFGITYDSTDHPHASSSAVLGDFTETDLVAELNNEWLWGGGGLSSLMSMDLDAMDFPLNMSNDYTDIAV